MLVPDNSSRGKKGSLEVMVASDHNQYYLCIEGKMALQSR